MNRTRAMGVAAVAAAVLILGGLIVALAVTRSGPFAQAQSPDPTRAASPTPATPSPTSSPTVEPTPSPTPMPTPTPNPFDQALLDSRVTVLFAGLDANDDRRTRTSIFNTDAMVVVSVSADKTQISSVALPRDTVDLPLGDGRYFGGKANSLVSTFGVEGLRNALEATYGIEIDYYLLLDMSDFGRLVTALDGIQVDVEQRLYDAGIGLDLQPGTQVLDGNDALRYVRTRVDTDYGRARRQQQMVLAVARELIDPPADIDIVSLAGALASLQTDIPLDKVLTFQEIARRAQGATITSQVLQPPRFALFEGVEAGPRGWVMIPNIPEIQAYVQAVMGD